FVTRQKNVVRAQRRVGGDNDADRPVDAREFFDRGDVLDIAHAGAAVLGGENHSEEPELAQFLDSGEGELAGFVPLHDVGADLALGKLADAFLQVQLLFVQLEIQESSI